jgi:flavin-dependent dehydrogenase
VAGQDDPDVVVVGAGPAGCATALWAAERGLSVRLLHRPEQRSYIPGETLPPAVEPLLRQLRAENAVLDQAIPRHEGHWVEWTGPRRFHPFGHDADGTWRGFHVCRRTFEQALRQAAIDAGVHIDEVTGVSPLVGDDGAVVGVVHSEGTVRARVVVDAAGGAHWLARALGLEVQTCSPRLVARYGLVTGAGPDEVALLSVDDDGWAWTAPVGHGTVAWVRLPMGGASAAGMDAPQRLADFEPVVSARGSDVTWRSVTAVAGAGYVLVGDAAFVLDPVSSHGVLHAIMSGMMAAEMIASEHLYGVAPHLTRAAYGEWSSTRFHTDVEHLRDLYAQLPNPPDWARS